MAHVHRIILMKANNRVLTLLNRTVMGREEKVIQVRMRRIIYPTLGTMRTEEKRRIKKKITGPETSEKVAVVAGEINGVGMGAMTMTGREKRSTGLRNRADHVMKAKKGVLGKGLKKKMVMKGIEVQGLGRNLIGKAKEKREEGEAPVMIGVGIGIEAEKEITLIQTEVGEAMKGIVKGKIMIAMTIDTIETEVLIEMAVQQEVPLLQTIETATGAKKDRIDLMNGHKENMEGNGITGDMTRKDTETADSLLNPLQRLLYNGN